MKRFFKKLSNYYVRKGFCVKFYLQEHTFSFDIYSEDEAFLGDPCFRSEVYYHSRVDKEFREKVLLDIKTELRNIESETGKLVKMVKK